MIKYLSSIHERVYVVVGHNHLKKYMVSADDRVLMLRAMVNHAGLANVIVVRHITFTNKKMNIHTYAYTYTITLHFVD